MSHIIHSSLLGDANSVVDLMRALTERVGICQRDGTIPADSLARLHEAIATVADIELSVALHLAGQARAERDVERQLLAETTGALRFTLVEPQGETETREVARIGAGG